MSAVLNNLAMSPASTPSKKVGHRFPAHPGALLTDEPSQQAAAAMKVMSLETPAKFAKSPALLFEEEEADEVPEVDELEDLRTRFVGDIEITEGTPVSPTVFNAPPDHDQKIKSRCSSRRSDDLYCSLFNTLRHVFTRPRSRPI
jgi:hypothetical protein